MLRYTEVAWDFDGTLYHSYPHIIRSMRRAMNLFGVDDSPENISSYVRVTASHAMKHYAPLCHVEYDEFRSWYRTIVNRTSDDVQLYPGIRELLVDIVKAGGRNHLCTNRQKGTGEVYLERDGLMPYFDCLASATPGVEIKPAPGLVQMILDHTGASPDRLIMIGDRPLDHEAAHAAGCVGCFFDPDRSAPQIPPVEYVADSVEDLRRILLGE